MSSSSTEVFVPRLGSVRVRPLPPKLIRLLERRATKDGRLDPNEFDILRFTHGVVEPSFTVAEVRTIFRKWRAVQLVLERIDTLSGFEVRVHTDPRLPIDRQMLRTAALIMNASRRLCDERRLHRARPRASRGRPMRHRGSRRTTATRAGPDSGDSDPDGEHHPLAVRETAGVGAVSGGPVQLRLDGGLDPVEVSTLQAPDRGRLYQRLGLDLEQRQAIEDAVRLVIAKRYRKGRSR